MSDRLRLELELAEKEALIIRYKISLIDYEERSVNEPTVPQAPVLAAPPVLSPEARPVIAVAEEEEEEKEKEEKEDQGQITPTDFSHKPVRLQVRIPRPVPGFVCPMGCKRKVGYEFNQIKKLARYPQPRPEGWDRDKYICVACYAGILDMRRLAAKKREAQATSSSAPAEKKAKSTPERDGNGGN